MITVVGPVWRVWQDARDSMTPPSRERLLVLGDQMARDAARAALEMQELREQLTEAEQDRCPDPDEHHGCWDGAGLPTLVREEHDRHHPDPWAICPHAMCRHAALVWST